LINFLFSFEDDVVVVVVVVGTVTGLDDFAAELSSEFESESDEVDAFRTGGAFGVDFCTGFPDADDGIGVFFEVDFLVADLARTPPVPDFPPDFRDGATEFESELSSSSEDDV